jgi:hypothetical protein
MRSYNKENKLLYSIELVLIMVLRGNEGIDNADCKIANDVAFNIVTVRLIGPNKELNPTKCKEEH